MPTTATAAIAAGRPIARPLAGSTGAETTAVAAGLGAREGVIWIGPGGDTGGLMTPPGATEGVRRCPRCFGVGATWGPEPRDADWVGAGANVGVTVRDGRGVGDFDGAGGAAATVIEPCAVPGPLDAVTDSRPDVVPTKLCAPDVEEFGATDSE